MNLLQNRIHFQDNNILTTSNFKQYQYDLIPEFLSVITDYISCQNNNYLIIKEKSCIEKNKYLGAYNSQVSECNVNIEDLKDKTLEKNFINFLIPTLIDGHHFYLNGNYYSPTMYVIDFPIVIKKKSIKLSSLFNSITIHFKEDLSIFTGINIPLSYLLQLFTKNDDTLSKLYEMLLKIRKLNHDIHTDENLINYYNKKFKTFTTIDEIINHMEKLFFDRYTKNLYQSCYPFEITLKNLIKCALSMYINDEKIHFVDLTKKRIVFVEQLLQPLFEKAAKIASLVSRGYKYDELKTDKLLIIKYFLTSSDKKKKIKGLSGNFLYDTCNLFSGILNNKLSMIQPGIDNPPAEVKSIHKSSKFRICPITCSSLNPGRVVSVVPNCKIDMFGKFL